MKTLGELIKNLEIIKAYYGSQIIENLGAYEYFAIKSSSSSGNKDVSIFNFFRIFTNAIYS